MDNESNQRGTVLLLVAWIIAIMGIVAIFLLYRAGAEWAVVSSFSERLHCQEVAEAVLRDRVQLFTLDESETDSNQDEWYGNGRFEDEKGDYQFTVIIEDEGSKPNINYLQNYDNLKPLLDGLSVNPLKDWLDADDIPLDDGAESNYYESLKEPYSCRNGFLSSLEELKAIKEGEKLYPALAPESTVYGKANPNALTEDTFAALLLAGGFDNSGVERIKNAFSNYRKEKRFQKIDDLVSLGLTKDQIEPLFKLKGNCNINFISINGLKVLWKECGFKEAGDEVLTKLIQSRDQKPYTNIDDIGKDLAQYLPQNNQGKNLIDLSDYFTVVTTIVRYKIWVYKGDNRFYLETVWERLPQTGATKWKAYPLSWKFYFKDKVPDIPPKPNTETA